jgi:hypothetical protein
MMRKTLRASILVLALCVPAFAGDIPMPPAPQPPPSSMTAANQVTDGETLTAESNSITETVLSVITSVVALL